MPALAARHGVRAAWLIVCVLLGALGGLPSRREVGTAVFCRLAACQNGPRTARA